MRKYISNQNPPSSLDVENTSQIQIQIQIQIVRQENTSLIKTLSSLNGGVGKTFLSGPPDTRRRHRNFVEAMTIMIIMRL